MLPALSGSSTKTGASRLPNEIWLQIFERSIVLYPSDYKSFSLACHKFRALLLPSLYKQVRVKLHHLKGDGSTFMSLSADRLDRTVKRLSFLSSDSIAPYIQYCEFCAYFGARGSEGVERSLSQVDKGDWSALYSFAFNALLKFVNLKDLHLNSLDLDHYDWPDEIRQLGSLKSLKLRNIRKDPLYASPNSLHLTRFEIESSSTTPFFSTAGNLWLSAMQPLYLTEINLHTRSNCDFFLINVAPTQDFPSLKRLSIYRTSASIPQLIAAFSRFCALENLLVRAERCYKDLALQNTTELRLPHLRYYNGPRLLLPLISKSNSLVMIQLEGAHQVDSSDFFHFLSQCQLDSVETLYMGLRHLTLEDIGAVASKFPSLKYLDLWMTDHGFLDPKKLLQAMDSIPFPPNIVTMMFSWDQAPCERLEKSEVKLLDKWASSHKTFEKLFLIGKASKSVWKRDGKYTFSMDPNY